MTSGVGEGGGSIGLGVGIGDGVAEGNVPGAGDGLGEGGGVVLGVGEGFGVGIGFGVGDGRGAEGVVVSANAKVAANNSGIMGRNQRGKRLPENGIRGFKWPDRILQPKYSINVKCFRAGGLFRPTSAAQG